MTQRQNVLDTLSSLFIVSADRSLEDAESCALAFGLCASTHLDLVINKLEILLNNSYKAFRKGSSFFGFLRDKNMEETQMRDSDVTNMFYNGNYKC